MLRSARIVLLACVAASLTPVANATEGSARLMSDRACKEATMIAAGGIAGFESLADPRNSAELRRLCGIRLYIHDFVWTHTSREIRRRILANFNGPADVELGLVSDADGWFAGLYQDEYRALGVMAEHAHVNVLAEHLQSDWVPFVDAARRRDIASVAPVLAPNQGEYRDGPFGSPRWQPYRDAALYGGGLTVDAPVDLFLTEPAGYRSFVEDEIRWARANHLHGAFILSPGNAAGEFERDAIEVADKLRHANALPDEFIVETYGAPSSGPYPNMVGSDAAPDSITGTARRLALHLHNPHR